MTRFPTCIRCLGNESDLDHDGVCTSCLSLHSERSSPSAARKSTVPSLANEAETNVERIESPDLSPSQAATVIAPAIDAPTVSKPLSVPHFTRYRDLAEIERGGMGIVYRAIEVIPNRVVALKTMNALTRDDERQERRFRTEAQALARLSHPGIVQVFDIGTENKLSYFTMEFVPGGTLAKRLRNGPRYTPEQSAELICHVAAALAAAHAVGVIHRDIKPSNILLTDVGKPKLSDFGLAALIDESVRMTHTGAMVGTPAYMSPEQAKGLVKTIGPQADVYSLGATLYEMLTGRPPFLAETPLATAMKVINDRLVPPREIDSTIPATLEAICVKCLEKDPHDRYPNAAQLANDLTRYLRHEPISQATVVQRTRRFFRKRDKATRNGVILLLILLITVLATVFATRPLPLWAMPQKTDSSGSNNRVEHTFPGEPPQDGEINLDQPPPQTRLTPKQRITLKLKRGESVRLVGAKGKPDYIYWENDETILSERNVGLGDGAPYFVAKDMSMLELCPDTMGDSYELEADLQYVEEHLKFFGRIGLYFRPKDEVENAPCRRYWHVDFTDQLSADPQNPIVGKFSQGYGLRLNNHCRVFLPKVNYSPLCLSVPVYPRDAACSLDNPWRTIKIKVTPTDIRVKWKNSNGEFVDTIMGTKKQMDDSTFELNDSIHSEPAVVASGAVCPEWKSRGSLGVLGWHATVAFRNVVLTPLKP